MAKKLVLAVVDAMHPGKLQEVIDSGEAPTFAALSLFLPPFSLVALSALAWLWLSRRRAAEQKHEGLRVLR